MMNIAIELANSLYGYFRPNDKTIEKFSLRKTTKFEVFGGSISLFVIEKLSNFVEEIGKKQVKLREIKKKVGEVEENWKNLIEESKDQKFKSHLVSSFGHALKSLGTFVPDPHFSPACIATGTLISYLSSFTTIFYTAILEQAIINNFNQINDDMEKTLKKDFEKASNNLTGIRKIFQTKLNYLNTAHTLAKFYLGEFNKKGLEFSFSNFIPIVGIVYDVCDCVITLSERDQNMDFLQRVSKVKNFVEELYKYYENLNYWSCYIIYIYKFRIEKQKLNVYLDIGTHYAGEKFIGKIELLLKDKIFRGDEAASKVVDFIFNEIEISEKLKKLLKEDIKELIKDLENERGIQK